MGISGGPASGGDGRCLGLGSRDCLRPIKTRPRDRATLAPPLGKKTFRNQLVPNRVIVLVRQIRQVFAQRGKQGAIANGGAILGNKGKNKITQGFEPRVPSGTSAVAGKLRSFQAKCSPKLMNAD